MDNTMAQIHRRVDDDIPVLAQTDVLVVGGGAGGMSAAVMAARQGVNVILVERYGCPGGMATFGEVTPFMASHLNGKTLDRPIYVEWCRKMHSYRTAEDEAVAPFNADMAAGDFTKEEAVLAMEDLLLEAGVRIIYHHTLTGVVMKNGEITAALFSSKSGQGAIMAKIFIDATGDGDLAALADFPFEFGNETGFCQPMTTCFKMSGVDETRIPDRQSINTLYDKAKADEELNCPRHNVLWWNTVQKGVIHFNTTRIIKKSSISGLELSEAEIEGRAQVRELIRFLRKRVPGFESARIHSLALHIGVRESRRIIGEIYQTAGDFVRAAKYPDGIARSNYPIDIHNPTGTGTVMQRMAPDSFYEIRYGTLIPKGSRNLLMGCRAISLDHALHSSVRIMPTICSIGQAAGMAAAYAIKTKCSPIELDGTVVRAKLRDAGAFI